MWQLIEIAGWILKGILCSHSDFYINIYKAELMLCSANARSPKILWKQHKTFWRNGILLSGQSSDLKHNTQDKTEKHKDLQTAAGGRRSKFPAKYLWGRNSAFGHVQGLQTSGYLVPTYHTVLWRVVLLTGELLFISVNRVQQHRAVCGIKTELQKEPGLALS